MHAERQAQLIENRIHFADAKVANDAILELIERRASHMRCGRKFRLRQPQGPSGPSDLVAEFLQVHVRHL